MENYSPMENQSVKSKKGMNARDKKLVVFVICGAVLCVILGFILVRMCTSNPYNSVDYSSLVQFPDVDTVQAYAPEDLINDVAVADEIEQRLSHAGKTKMTKDFIRTDTGGICSTEEEYEDYIRQYLVRLSKDDLRFSCSQLTWENYSIHSKVGEPTASMIDHEYKLLSDNYHHRYEFEVGENKKDMSFDEWLKDQYASKPENFDETLKEIAKTNATTKMITYAYWDMNRDVLKWSNKRYDKFCDKMLSEYGFTKDTIKALTGYTWDEYCEAMDLRSLFMAREAAYHLYDTVMQKSSD